MEDKKKINRWYTVFVDRYHIILIYTHIILYRTDMVAAVSLLQATINAISSPRTGYKSKHIIDVLHSISWLAAVLLSSHYTILSTENKGLPSTLYLFKNRAVHRTYHIMRTYTKIYSNNMCILYCNHIEQVYEQHKVLLGVKSFGANAASVYKIIIIIICITYLWVYLNRKPLYIYIYIPKDTRNIDVKLLM